MTATHEFHPLTIAAMRPETAHAVSIAFDVPDSLRETFRFRPGQHVTLRAMLDGEELRRTYSITSRADDPLLTITVKRVAGGLFSGHLHDGCRRGQSIDVMPPTGRFVVPPPAGQPRNLLAIAAGSGITPVIGMIRQVLEAEPHSRFVLLYGSRTVDAIIFREEFEDLKDRHLDRFSVLHVLSRDEEADVPLLAGRLDADRIRALLPSAARPETIDHCFLCGPGSLIKDARDTLLALGVPRDRIHFEYFKAGAVMTPRRTMAGPPPAEAKPTGAEAVVTVDGARKSFRVPPEMAVVDAALAAGVAVPYSCKGGMCCTCRAKLVEGRVEMLRNFSLEPWEMEAGFVLACQSVPLTDRVVLNFDEM